MHFKNARNASVYAVFRAFFTQSLAKLRIQKGICQQDFIFFCNFFATLFYNFFHRFLGAADRTRVPLTRYAYGNTLKFWWALEVISFWWVSDIA